MAGKKRREKPNWAVAAMVAMVLIGTLALVWSPAPEEMVAGSPDGAVQVSGLTRSAASLTVERLQGVEVGVEGALGPVYELTLDRGLLEQGELTVVVSGGVDVTEVVLYEFDRDTLTWLPLATSFDLTDGSVSAVIEFSGSTLVTAVSRVL